MENSEKMPVSQAEYKRWLNNYKLARNALLSILALTLLNILLAYVGIDIYMLYSSFTSYYFGYTSMICLVRPEIWSDVSSEVLSIGGYIYIGLALMALVPFFVCWLCSKKHYGWLTAGLVFWIIDILMMFVLTGTFEESMLLDIGFHILIAITFVKGISAGKKMARSEVVEAEGQVCFSQSSDADIQKESENPFSSDDERDMLSEKTTDEVFKHEDDKKKHDRMLNE